MADKGEGKELSSSVLGGSDMVYDFNGTPNQQLNSMKISSRGNRSICIKTSLDKRDCYITGITFSSQNQIILVDYESARIKMLDINTKTIKHVQLETSALDVTTVTNDKVAVTIPQIETIQFITFTPDKLTLGHKIQVNGWCHGISHCQGKLAVTFRYPNSLKILDLNGNVLTAVSKTSGGGHIFEKPDYVATNCHSIYVTDLDKKALLWFSWEGEFMGSYRELVCPQGVTALDNGSVLVCDNRRVLNVSGDCKESEVVLKYQIVCPRNTCWCAESKLLCVSNSDDKGKRNEIQIYEVS